MKAWLLAGGFVVALLAGLWARGNHYRNQAIQYAGQADSLEAALDTTRALFLGEITVWTRRAIQTRIERDSLDKALKQRPVVRVQAAAVVRPLDTVFVGLSPPDETLIGRATFEAYREPYRVQATATGLPDRNPPELQMRIVLDTARLGLRVTCGERVRGIAPASVFLSTPEWLSVRIDSGAVTPLACQNEMLMPRSRGVGYYVFRGGVVAGGLIALLSAFKN